MKSAFAAAAAALCFAASALAQDPPLVNTPINPPVCQPLLITWSGGTPPYFLSIVPGGQPGAPALFDFGQQSGTSLTWRVNVTAGTSLGLTLRDNTGAVSQSAPFTVQDSSDTSCLTGGSSSSSTTSGSTSSTTGSTSSTSSSTRATSSSTSLTVPPVTSPTAPGSSTSHSSTTSGSASSSASVTPSSAATMENVRMGLVGAFGAALVAIMA